MELWAVITFASAFLQNLRSTLQKHLKGRMGTTGATFSRFGYGLPFALVCLAVLYFGLNRPMPTPDAAFWAWAILGSTTQIVATFLLVHLFSLRNLVVGTAYSRTEPAQAAIIALVFLGEHATGSVILAIVLSVAGVMLISVARTKLTPQALLTSVASRPAAIGLASGFFFSLSGIAYRGASLALAPSLPAPDSVTQAGYTLAIVMIMQTVSMFAWMAWREPEELRRVGREWRVGLMVGFVGAIGSFGWFTAMTLQQVAAVRALAQVEMLFTFASSVLVFKESINRLEIAGCALIVCGILSLVLL